MFTLVLFRALSASLLVAVLSTSVFPLFFAVLLVLVDGIRGMGNLGAVDEDIAIHLLSAVVVQNCQTARLMNAHAGTHQRRCQGERTVPQLIRTENLSLSLISQSVHERWQFFGAAHRGRGEQSDEQIFSEHFTYI